jgi:hypothetical protein
MKLNGSKVSTPSATVAMSSDRAIAMMARVIDAASALLVVEGK